MRFEGLRAGGGDIESSSLFGRLFDDPFVLGASLTARSISCVDGFCGTMMTLSGVYATTPFNSSLDGSLKPTGVH